MITFARTLSLAVLIAAATSSCSEFQVRTEFDYQTNFDALRTYAWSEDSRVTSGSAVLDASSAEARIRKSISSQLNAKGYRAVAAKDADFLVAFHGAVKHKLESSDLDGQRGFGAGLGRADDFGASYGGGSGSIVEEYEEGTLAIGMLPPSGGEPLWRGAARTPVIEDHTPEQAAARIERAVKKILSKFPP